MTRKNAIVAAGIIVTVRATASPPGTHQCDRSRSQAPPEYAARNPSVAKRIQRLSWLSGIV
jgi:hypothetical protein